MTITIQESNLLFGEYEKSKVFYVEKSSAYSGLGEGICTIEFVLLHKNQILMIEAKSSSPQPRNQHNFDEFIHELYVKFAHSIDLFFSLVLRRIVDQGNDMPECFKTADYSKIEIKLILVINGHKTEWLSPISDALMSKLKMQIKTWNLKLVVINHEMALEYGLLKNTTLHNE